MDAAELERLLNEDESSSLDFKLDQYPFAGATDQQKGEFIKDILAFANAWRRTDAFILMGVEEVRGGRSIVHGVTTHLDEHSIQQLVNSKTNRPVEFSYQAVPVDGKQIGLIRIAVQDRPSYLKSNYGKLDKSAVYIRRGSATVLAEADEIARMGVANLSKGEIPTLNLQFVNLTTMQWLGRQMDVRSVLLRLPEPSRIPDAQDRGRSGLHSTGINENYYREYARLLHVYRSMTPIGFMVTNTGTTLLRNPRLRFQIPKSCGIRLRTDAQMPKEPTYNWHAKVLHTSVPALDAGIYDSIQITAHAQSYNVLIEFDDVQPKDSASSQELYIGADHSNVIELEGTMFADNLPDPVRTPLIIDITTAEQSISVADLMREIKRIADRRRQSVEEMLNRGTI